MHVRPATIDDVSAIADVSMASMADDELMGLHGFSNPYAYLYPLSWREGLVRRHRRVFYQDNITPFNMVTDPSDADWTGTERVIGHIVMTTTRPIDSTTLSQRLWLGLNSAIHKAEDSARWYLGSDWSISYTNLGAFFRQQQETNPADFLEPKGRDHHQCKYLVVSPDYHRRGVGRALIRHVQERAAAEEVPILLTSSAVGEKFYLSCGFREIARLPLAEGCDIISPLLLWDNDMNARNKTDA